MIKGDERTSLRSRSSWAQPLLLGTFILFIASLGAVAAFILIRDGNASILFSALLAGLLIWYLERLEGQYIPESTRAWSPMPGRIIPIAAISLVIFLVCLPTLHSYFSGDEFAYIPLFQNLSFGQFLHLFHSDLSQGVLGWSPHELRPLYGLSFRLSYAIWGIHPLGYHLTSILLHAINSTMVFLIARRLAPGESWRAGFAGILFAVQPIHSWTISWANGSLTETVPSLFYIFAFLCFMSFRATRRARYYFLSVTAFAACLLSKETSVTLPIVLVSYDAFQLAARKLEKPDDPRQPAGTPWLRLLAAYIPYAILLLGYLELRRVAFTNLLLEDKWGPHINEAMASPAGFWLHFRHLLAHVASIQTFNIHHLMLWFPRPELILVLGLYLAWIAALWRRRVDCQRSILVIVYFGLVWYGITNLPLLASYNDPHHLYLPSIGPCIAAAFLAAPGCNDSRSRFGNIRLLGAALLVCFCAVQLWTEDVNWARKAEVTEKGTAQLAAALAKMSKPALVVVWFPELSSSTESWDEDLPYSLQPPFQSTDLYSRASIVEHPDIYCCPLDHWWPKTKSGLDAVLSGNPEEPVEVERFSWDARSSTFEVEVRTLPRGAVRNDIMNTLGEPLDEVEDVKHEQAISFVDSLGRLASSGP
jgi:hypothetical protein